MIGTPPNYVAQVELLREAVKAHWRRFPEDETLGLLELWEAMRTSVESFSDPARRGFDWLTVNATWFQWCVAVKLAHEACGRECQLPEVLVLVSLRAIEVSSAVRELLARVLAGDFTR